MDSQDEQGKDSSPEHSSAQDLASLKSEQDETVDPPNSEQVETVDLPNSEQVETVDSPNLQNIDEPNTDSSPKLQKESVSAENFDDQTSIRSSNSDIEESPNLPESQSFDAVTGDETSAILPSAETISPEHDTEVRSPVSNRKDEYIESSSLPESNNSSQANTNKYLAGNSSSYPKEPEPIVKKTKVLKKKKEKKLSLSDESSLKNASPPRRPKFKSENACQTDGIVEKLEKLELPGLVAVQQRAGIPAAGRAGCSVQDKNFQQTVLCSSINAKFHGSVGAVLVPLDNLSVRSNSVKSEQSITARRGVTVDMHANYHTSNKNNASEGRNVDAHVTYREPNQRKGHGPQWKVDIDGSGLQVIVNMADKNKKKIKPKFKVKRPLLSHWPKKKKIVINKAAKNRLEWLEDEAEEKHIMRMERARVGLRGATTFKKSDEESNQEKPRNSLTSVKTASIENHIQRMIKADYLKEQNVRLIPESPNYIPPYTYSLPSSPNMGVYEDENSKRMREAREFYNNISMKQT